jgi:hypothetical protein
MMIAIESLLFLLGGFVLAFVLLQVFARPSDAGRERKAPAVPVVKLLRLTQFSDGHEETRLLVNDREILIVTDQGLRQEAYAAEVEHLEAMATVLASALDVTVAFTRRSADAADEKRDKGASAGASAESRARPRSSSSKMG